MGPSHVGPLVHLLCVPQHVGMSALLQACLAHFAFTLAEMYTLSSPHLGLPAGIAGADGEEGTAGQSGFAPSVMIVSHKHL